MLPQSAGGGVRGVGGGGEEFYSIGAYSESDMKVEKLFMVQVQR